MSKQQSRSVFERLVVSYYEWAKLHGSDATDYEILEKVKNIPEEDVKRELCCHLRTPSKIKADILRECFPYETDMDEYLSLHGA
jgi:hypothetical protein